MLVLRPYFTKLICFNPSIGLTSVPTVENAAYVQYPHSVSIPQSGLQAFRQPIVAKASSHYQPFQSLNRAYKRSDSGPLFEVFMEDVVSIPQSGLQAFR